MSEHNRRACMSHAVQYSCYCGARQSFAVGPCAVYPIELRAARRSTRARASGGARALLCTLFFVERDACVRAAVRRIDVLRRPHDHRALFCGRDAVCVLVCIKSVARAADSHSNVYSVHAGALPALSTSTVQHATCILYDDAQTCKCPQNMLDQPRPPLCPNPGAQHPVAEACAMHPAASGVAAAHTATQLVVERADIEAR